ncbi:MAG: hypothetical protein WDO14_15250 [Bacteroidota bacterium]
MASIFPDLEYDIFISYRQNDNKYDKWVSDFVHNLSLELVATLKDKLSIYFDENPDDGLRETHNVDKSLAGKLKSLIFIPIISNTYCDTSSFAWQQEFLAFKKLAAGTSLGIDVGLSNGNVASRILPIRIHEIDTEDVQLLEQELSGSLRSIDFIYKSSGVNRPLRHEDDSHGAGNQNATIYRNQINKVANAVKEIVQGIKRSRQGPPPLNTALTSSLKEFTVNTISASVPENMRYAIVRESAPTVYLAWTSFELKAKREEMAIVLQKAGFNVVPGIDCPSDENAFREKTSEALAKAQCSLHIVGNEFGRRFEENEEISFPAFQFDEAKKRSADASQEFQTFVWFTPEGGQEMKPSQAKFINYIRNTITRNMTFSNSAGAMQLVDDMRVIMLKKEHVQLDTKDTDIFFIFNQQDEQEAQHITDLISNVYPIETMNIAPDGEDEYRELSKQQIQRSKLAVIYFRYAADWALPFVKQIWKQVGGASSPTPIMLVGEDDPKTNAARIFKAPKVVSFVVPKKEVPEEIKKVYIKVIEP